LRLAGIVPPDADLIVPDVQRFILGVDLHGIQVPVGEAHPVTHGLQGGLRVLRHRLIRFFTGDPVGLMISNSSRSK
jgi:hypothetical protein